MCRLRLEQLLHGQVSAGYGLHLFDPAWFENAEKDEEKQTSPTVIPTAATRASTVSRMPARTTRSG